MEKDPYGVGEETRDPQGAPYFLPIVFASRTLKVETGLLAAEVDRR